MQVGRKSTTGASGTDLGTRYSGRYFDLSDATDDEVQAFLQWQAEEIDRVREVLRQIAATAYQESVAVALAREALAVSGETPE